MTNPFDPGRRQVITVHPDNCYRATESTIDAPWPSEERSFFINSPPSKWSFSSSWRAKYAEMYGQEALDILLTTGTVVEHMNPVFVAGAYWRTDPIGPIFPPNPKDSGGFLTLEERVAALERYVYNS